jgi:hypothetical protein
MLTTDRAWASKRRPRGPPSHKKRLRETSSHNDPGWSSSRLSATVRSVIVRSDREEEMTREAGAGEVAVRRLGRRAARVKPIRARPETCWDDVVTMPVEVMTPDRESAKALLEEAAAHFRAEAVQRDGETVLVRLRLEPAAPVGWVFELLALLERWLEARNLRAASVHHGSRSYVITATSPTSGSDAGPEPAAAT